VGEGADDATARAARFAQPGSLSAAIDERLAAGVQVRSREGEDDAPEEVLARCAALEQIVQELQE
jgi:hypothetical protein